MNKRSNNKDGSHFNTEHLAKDLKGRAVRGGAVTFLGQAAKFVLQLGSTMILARILTPEDFGLIAMVAAITGFVVLFKDLGLSMATVQRSEINHDQISTLFWINVIISLGLTLVTAALAPVIAWFYQDPRLVWITLVLGTAFIFGGLTVQHQALLRRQMRFVDLAVIDVIAMAAGILTGIVCGMYGLGYWSLVAMQLVTAMATAIGVWIKCDWRPGHMKFGTGVRPMLSFGGYMTGFSLVNYFARNLDNVLLGRFAGAQATGLYSRAYSLLLLPIGQVTAPISAVAIPTLSRLQDEPARYQSYYLKAVTAIAYMTMPMVVIMAVLSSEIVTLILGDQWAVASKLFRILAVVALLQPIGATVGWVYVSLGQTRRMFNWVCLAGPVTVLSFIIGIQWGALGVAYGYAIVNCVLIGPQLAYAYLQSPIDLKNVLLNIYRPLLLSITMGIVMLAVHGAVLQYGVIATILVSLVVGAISILVLSQIFSKVRADFVDIVSTVKLALVKS